MTDYPAPSVLLQRLREHGHRAKKRFGQRFLINESTLEKIVAETGADSDTLVVEIGPGPATLTTLLARQAGGVLAVERDETLRSFYAENFASDSRIRLHFADALKADLRSLADSAMEEWGLHEKVLAGNLPFQITTPLLFKQLGPARPWKRMVLMVQREVAERISAPPCTRTYGILTVKLAYWWKVVSKIEVPASDFRPQPKVDATVLTFEPLVFEPAFDEATWKSLSTFIDMAFNQRRKKLYNTPLASWGPRPGKEAIRAGLETLGLNPEGRAETLSPADFLALHNLLREKNKSEEALT